MVGLFHEWFDRFVFLSFSTSLFIAQIILGFESIEIRLNLVVVGLVVVMLQAVLSNVIFTGYISLSGALFLKQFIKRPSIEHTEYSDPVTAIVPVHKDANVLETSVTSLLQSSHPVHVTIVCEPEDDPSIRQAVRLATEFENVTCLRNTRYPGSKAGAINYAIEETDAAYIGVFDADEQVDPKFIDLARHHLEEADVVQGRTVPQPDGFIGSLAYYESVLLSYIGRRLLYSLTEFRMAASRAVIFRRRAIETIGGYDQTMLTEDYYFAYQCYTAGLTVRELLHAPSTIDAAHTISDWWGQRKRWMRGYMQVFRHLTINAVFPTNYRDVLGLVICGSSLIGGVLLISLFSKLFVLVIIGAGTLTLIPLGMITVFAATIRYLDYRHGPLDRFGISWIIAPLLFPLYGLAVIKALVEYILQGTGDWYHVKKHP